MKALLNRWDKPKLSESIYVSKGDIVLATEEAEEFGFTAGKEYEILEITLREHLRIKNDKDEIDNYSVEYFKKKTTNYVQKKKEDIMEDIKDKVYIVMETYEGEDNLRESNIIAASKDPDMAKTFMQHEIDKDFYGLIAKNGVYVSNELYYETNYNDGFVSYSIIEKEML